MRLLTYLAALGSGLLFGSLALAQTTQGTDTVGPSTGTQAGSGGSYGSLYRDPTVRRDLGLSGAQLDRLNSATLRVRARYRDQIDRLSKLSGAERVRRLEQLNRKFNSDWLHAAQEILTAKQLRRYRQIELQQRGLDAFSDAEIQKKLNLTTAQLRKFQELRDTARREKDKLRLQARDNVREAARRHEAYRQKWYEATIRALEPAQRRMWRDMVGGNFNSKPSLTGPHRK